MAVTPELNEYVQKARQAGISDSVIRAELMKIGWQTADINAVVPLSVPTPPPPVLQNPFQGAPVSEAKPQAGAQPVQQGQPQTPAQTPPPMRHSRTPFIITVAVLLLAGGAIYYFLTDIVTYADKLMGKTLPVPSLEDASQNQALPATDNSANTIMDCGSSRDCFIAAAQTCTPAKFDFKSTVDFSQGILKSTIVTTTDNPTKYQQTQRTLEELSQSPDGRCTYTYRVLEIINPDMPEEAKSMILNNAMVCTYDNAELVTRLQNSAQGTGSFSFSSGDTSEEALQRMCADFGQSTPQEF